MQTLTFYVWYRLRCLEDRGDGLGPLGVLASAYGESARVMYASINSTMSPKLIKKVSLPVGLRLVDPFV